MFNIRLHVVVVSDNNAPSVLLADPNLKTTIHDLIQHLNNLISDADLHFEFDPNKDFEEIFDTNINTDKPSHMERERLSRKNPDKITLIFRDHGTISYSGGVSYNVTLLKETMKQPNKLAHELGHYFHLAHTFPREVVDIDQLPTEEEKKKAEEKIKNGSLIDINELTERIRSYVEDEGHPVKDGLKALEVYMDGDKENVDDTPYDFGAKIFGSFNRACADDPKIEFQVKFKNGNVHTYTYIPTMRSNFMSYFDGCSKLDHNFSKGQIKVIHNSLTSANRMRLIKGNEWDSANAQDFVSPVAISRKGDSAAVFASNKEGQIMSKVWDASRGSYWPSNEGEWFGLGDTGMISPVAVSRRPDTIDLFARHITGKIVNKIWNESTSEYWPGNKWADNVVKGADTKPAVIHRKSHLLNIFVRMPDGTITTQAWDKKWGDPENLGGEGVSAPAGIARRPDIIDIYVRWSDGSIHSKVWSEKKNNWYPSETDWIYLGGKGFDSPAVVARRPDKIDIFIRWDDGTIRNKVWDDSRGSYWPSNETWQSLGGQVTSEPVAICRNPQSIALFARWVDGTVRLKVWDDSHDSWLPSNKDWYNLGGDTIGRPAAIVRNENRIIIYARWTDDSIRSKVWNGELDQWWPGQTEWFLLGTP